MTKTEIIDCHECGSEEALIVQIEADWRGEAVRYDCEECDYHEVDVSLR